MQPAIIIKNYEELLRKAMKIVDSAPYWAVFEELTVSLSIDGEDAILKWYEAETCYDSASLESQEKRFPASLLLMSFEEIDEWSKVKKNEYEEKRRRENEARRIAKEQALADRERSEYERLKAKFET